MAVLPSDLGGILHLESSCKTMSAIILEAGVRAGTRAVDVEVKEGARPEAGKEGKMGVIVVLRQMSRGLQNA